MKSFGSRGPPNLAKIGWGIAFRQMSNLFSLSRALNCTAVPSMPTHCTPVGAFWAKPFSGSSTCVFPSKVMSITPSFLELELAFSAGAFLPLSRQYRSIDRSITVLDNSKSFCRPNFEDRRSRLRNKKIIEYCFEWQDPCRWVRRTRTFSILEC